MDAKAFFKAQKRLCEHYGNCDICPLRQLADEHDCGSCWGLELSCPDELVDAVEQFAAQEGAE